MQDVSFQRAQLGPGFEAEFVPQQRPYPRARRQRVGLAPGPVQGGDEDVPEPFAQRVLGDEDLQVGDHFTSHAEVDARRGPGLEQAAPHLLEPGSVRNQPVAVTGE